MGHLGRHEHYVRMVHFKAATSAPGLRRLINKTTEAERFLLCRDPRVQEANVHNIQQWSIMNKQKA